MARIDTKLFVEFIGGAYGKIDEIMATMHSDEFPIDCREIIKHFYDMVPSLMVVIS
jgi:hypothetical protein